MMHVLIRLFEFLPSTFARVFFLVSEIYYLASSTSCGYCVACVAYVSDVSGSQGDGKQVAGCSA